METARALKIYNAVQPFTDDQPAMKWDGEWHITIEVFRDLGTAFAAVLVLIFILMVGWFRSFLTPLIVMAAIPFSLVGILPAHGLMGAFFSATSMIGFMAGAGIVVRNSIILVDFIEQRLAEGMPLAEAVVDAGAVRFRPMLLTALAVVVGASVILADPIFQGLAISLMAGEIASLADQPHGRARALFHGLFQNFLDPSTIERSKRRRRRSPGRGHNEYNALKTSGLIVGLLLVQVLANAQDQTNRTMQQMRHLHQDPKAYVAMLEDPKRMPTRSRTKSSKRSNSRKVKQSRISVPVQDTSPSAWHVTSAGKVESTRWTSART